MRHYVRVLTLPNDSVSKRLLMYFIQHDKQSTRAVPLHLRSAAVSLRLLDKKYEAGIEACFMPSLDPHTHAQQLEQARWTASAPLQIATSARRKRMTSARRSCNLHPRSDQLWTD